jgi:hypothetical protein
MPLCVYINTYNEGVNYLQLPYFGSGVQTDIKVTSDRRGSLMECSFGKSEVSLDSRGWYLR